MEPSAAVVDAQSVKTSSNVAESSQGIDPGKKIKGRKRRLITDTLGLVLTVLVTAAWAEVGRSRLPPGPRSCGALRAGGGGACRRTALSPQLGTSERPRLSGRRPVASHP
ncbi:transposase [Streptomyces filamentosus]